MHEKEWNNAKVRKLGMGGGEGDDAEVRGGLKKAVALIGTFDTLIEDVIRLKFGLDMEARKNVAAGVGSVGAEVGIV